MLNTYILDLTTVQQVQDGLWDSLKVIKKVVNIVGYLINILNNLSFEICPKCNVKSAPGAEA